MLTFLGRQPFHFLGNVASVAYAKAAKLRAKIMFNAHGYHGESFFHRHVAPDFLPRFGGAILSIQPDVFQKPA